MLFVLFATAIEKILEDKNPHDTFCGLIESLPSYSIPHTPGTFEEFANVLDGNVKTENWAHPEVCREMGISIKGAIDCFLEKRQWGCQSILLNCSAENPTGVLTKTLAKQYQLRNKFFADAFAREYGIKSFQCDIECHIEGDILALLMEKGDLSVQFKTNGELCFTCPNSEEKMVKSNIIRANINFEVNSKGDYTGKWQVSNAYWTRSNNHVAHSGEQGPLKGFQTYKLFKSWKESETQFTEEFRGWAKKFLTYYAELEEDYCLVTATE